MANYSSVSCQEVHGSVQENVSLSTYTASVTLQCSWSARYSLINDILLNQRAYPYNGLLLPRTCAIRPMPGTYDADGQAIDYDDFALVTVNYEAPGGEDDEGPQDPVDMVSEELEPTSEFVTQDYKKFSWYTSAGVYIRELKEDEAPGRLVQGLALVRTFFNVPYLPASILSLPGKCNSSQFTSRLLGLTFAAETLLFTPPGLSRTLTTAGVSGWTMRTRFIYKPQGWNKFWIPDISDYGKIYVKSESSGTASEYKSHPTANFSEWLF